MGTTIMPRPSGRAGTAACLALLVLTACGAQEAAETRRPAAEPTEAPASVTADSTASTTGSPVGEQPSIEFDWPDDDNPVVTRDLAGSTDAFINPGAVIEHEGVLHMFANVFTGWPGPVSVPHLTSTDGGATWSLVSEDPVMRSADVPYADPGADVSTGFVTDDGTWILVFETVNASEPWEIGLATAPGPDGPWTVSAEPVLRAEEGSWDAAGLGWPSVVRTADGWAMYYSAFEQVRRGGVIGMATSSDGLTWTKMAEPVLEPEAAWENGGLDRPRVVATEGGYLMIYAGARLTDRGVAQSADGLTWQRDGEVPAMTMDDFPVPGQAWDAALVNDGGTLTYYLEIGSGSPGIGTQVYRATAELP